MAKAQLLKLAYKNTFHPLRQDVKYYVGLLGLSLRMQPSFKLMVAVKEVLDVPLVAARHEDERINARSDSLRGRLLDEWLIHNWH